MDEAIPAGPMVLRSLHAGPLGAHAGSLVERLAAAGYAAATIRAQVRSLAQFSRWLGRQGLEVEGIGEREVERFLKHRKRGNHPTRNDSATLTIVLGHLRDMGAVPTRAAEVESCPHGELVRVYSEYLTCERGLAPVTLPGYLPTIRQFLVYRFGAGSPVLGQIGPGDIHRFVLQYAHVGSPGRAKLMVTALRSFFRFLFLRGEIAVDLAISVPTVTDWRLSTLPRFISPEQVESLLQGCDRSTALGLRNYAILLLLARLGLRAGEVVAIELDDFDWERGLLMVRGKGRRRDQLPVPQDVGEAVVAYLRQARPRTLVRRLFIRHRAPLRGFAGSVAVCSVVQRAIDRAAIPSKHKGAHVLRHSLATRMLSQGASLGEIGEILRHQLPSTTEIYAKVDIAGLRELAQPWPGGAV